MPKALETHVIARNNSKKYPGSTDEIFRVVRKPRLTATAQLNYFDYEVYASKYDGQWTNFYYSNPLISTEDDGNKIVVRKNHHAGTETKEFVLEYDEAQELLLLLLTRHQDRKAYEFSKYRGRTTINDGSDGTKRKRSKRRK